MVGNNHSLSKLTMAPWKITTKPVSSMSNHSSRHGSCDGFSASAGAEQFGVYVASFWKLPWPSTIEFQLTPQLAETHFLCTKFNIYLIICLYITFIHLLSFSYQMFSAVRPCQVVCHSTALGDWTDGVCFPVTADFVCTIDNRQFLNFVSRALALQDPGMADLKLNSTLEIIFHEADKWIAILLVGIGDVLRRWFLHNAYLNFWGKLSSVWSESGFGWASLRPLAALFRWAGKQGGCGMPRHAPWICYFGVVVKKFCLLLWEFFLFNLVMESPMHFETVWVWFDTASDSRKLCGLFHNINWEYVSSTFQHYRHTSGP